MTRARLLELDVSADGYRLSSPDGERVVVTSLELDDGDWLAPGDAEVIAHLAEHLGVDRERISLGAWDIYDGRLDAAIAEVQLDAPVQHVLAGAELEAEAEAESPWASRPLQVGDRVEGGDTEDDYDTGQVIAIHGDQVTVAWDSLATTTGPAELLRPEGEEVLHRG